MPLIQQRLVVEQVVVRRRAGHVQVNDPFGLRREVRRCLEDLFFARAGRCTERAVRHQASQCCCAKALGRLAQKVTARNRTDTLFMQQWIDIGLGHIDPYLTAC